MDSGLLASIGPGMTSASIRHVAFDAALEVLIFLAGRVAADRLDLVEEVPRLEHVALLDLPHAVILPGADMLRVDAERALVPELREFVVAELARRIAEIVRDVGRIVGVERLE